MARSAKFTTACLFMLSCTPALSVARGKYAGYREIVGAPIEEYSGMMYVENSHWGQEK